MSKKKLPRQEHSSTIIGTNRVDSIIILSTGVISTMVGLIWLNKHLLQGWNKFLQWRMRHVSMEGKVMIARSFLENNYSHRILYFHYYSFYVTMNRSLSRCRCHRLE